MLALQITLYCLLFLLLVKLAVRDSGIHCLYFYPKPYLEEAQRRAELVMEVQAQVMDQFNDSRMGDTVEVLCDGWDGQSMSYVGRSYAESPGIDGSIYFTSDSPVEAGDFVRVRITGAMDGELTGERTEE